jgi:hypothetical protein
MKTIDVSQVSALVPFLQSGSDEPLFLTRQGETVAAIVPVDEAHVENLLLSINPKFQAILERSQKRLEAEGGLTGEEVRKQLNLPPA